jgi:putative tricarboxylic transport membrane protein
MTARTIQMREGIFGGSVLLLGFAVAWGASQITVGFSFDPVGPRLFPLLIAGGMVLSGSVILFSALSARSAAEPADDIASNYDWRPIVLISLGLLIQIAFIETLGWIPVAMIAFVLGCWAFGNKRFGLNLAIGFVLSSVALVAFNFGLDLKLPTGVIGQLLSSKP